MVRWCKRRYCVVVNDAVTASLVETEPLVEMAGVDDTGIGSEDDLSVDTDFGGSYLSVSPDSIFDTASSWSTLTLSYFLRASKELSPLLP